MIFTEEEVKLFTPEQKIFLENLDNHHNINESSKNKITYDFLSNYELFLKIFDETDKLIPYLYNCIYEIDSIPKKDPVVAQVNQNSLGPFMSHVEISLSSAIKLAVNDFQREKQVKRLRIIIENKYVFEQHKHKIKLLSKLKKDFPEWFV